MHKSFGFLAQTDLAQTWPVVDEKRIAPYQFYLVSLDPDIVLMQTRPDPLKL